jgi:hypothetical protein
MSYFKYAERSAESRVDWGEISKSMVDMLNEQTRLRNLKLDEAQKRQTEINTKASEAPIGSDRDANATTSNFAGDVTEYSLMLDRLWRSGKMDYREYMTATSNLMTGTTAYFKQKENYDATYEEHVKRMQPNENGFIPGSTVEEVALSRAEDFGNFNKYRPEIDAPTGNLFLVNDDGTRFAGVTELGVDVLSTYNRINLTEQVKGVVDNVGSREVILSNGRVATVASALAESERTGDEAATNAYKEAESGYISSILGVNDNATTSTLADYSGNFVNGYITDEETLKRASEVDSNVIIMMPSPRDSRRYIGAVEDDITDEDFKNYIVGQMGVEEGSEQYNNLVNNRKRQKGLAEGFVRNMIRAGLDYTETEREVTPYKAPSVEERKYMDDVSARNNMAAHWMTILTGDQEARDVAIAALETQPNVQEINDATDQVIVTFVDDSGGTSQKAYPKTQVGRRDRTTKSGELVAAPRLNVYDWSLTGIDVHNAAEDQLIRAGVQAGLIQVGEDGAVTGMVSADTSTGIGTRTNILEPVDFGSGTIKLALPADVKIKNTLVPKGTVTEFTPEGALEATMKVSETGQDYEEGVSTVLDAMFNGNIDTSQIISFDEEIVSSKTAEEIEQDVLRVMIPDLMESPLFIPIDSEHSPAEIKAIVRALEDAANNNVMVSGENLKEFIRSIRDEDYRSLVAKTNRIMKGTSDFTRTSRASRTSPAPSPDAPRPVQMR